MKLFAAGCVVAVLATVAVQFASSATSTSTKSIPARVKALEAKSVVASAATRAANNTLLVLPVRSVFITASWAAAEG